MIKKVSPNPEQNAHHINNFNGNIQVKGEFIAGDQVNSYNIQPPANREEFIIQLQQVQAQIIEIKKSGLSSAQTKILELAEGKVNEAVSEAQQPQTHGESIKATLTEAKETLDMLSGSLTSAMTLGTTIGGLILIVIKIFGG